MRFAMLSASGFPHEHWDAQGIRAAFTPIGSVCCIDPSFILEKDFSAVRVVVKMAGTMTFPATLLVHDAFGECTTEVEVRLVRAWTGEEDALDAASLHFDTEGAGGSPAREQPRLSDIDEGSLIGTPPTPPRPRKTLQLPSLTSGRGSSPGAKQTVPMLLTWMVPTASPQTLPVRSRGSRPLPVRSGTVCSPKGWPPSSLTPALVSNRFAPPLLPWPPFPRAVLV
jgi:hypothetical protein